MPLSDTSPEIAMQLLMIQRRMTPARKWKNQLEEYRLARSLHRAGVQERHGNVTSRDVNRDWISQSMSVPPLDAAMNSIESDYQPVLRHTIQVLEKLGLAYAVGGSIASSLHGIGRMTRDADILVEPFAGRELIFLAQFPAPEYYLSPEAVTQAHRERSCFNILHMSTGYKIDIFIRPDAPFERSVLSRRSAYPMPESEHETLSLCTPEDIILFKLRWYRLGGEVSERQWSDILGVLRVQGDRLDREYLAQWSQSLQLHDLWCRISDEVAKE